MIKGCSRVGRELRRVDAPVDDFRVGVSERASRSRSRGRIERAVVVGVEGRQRRVDVFDLSRSVGEGAVAVGLGRGVGVRVDGLPDGEEAVDVGVMEPEDGVEACVGDVAHVSSVSDQTVDGVVHVLEGVVGSASVIGESSVRERCVI